MRSKRLFLVLALAGGLVAQRGYDERFRPQFHFTPSRNWTNDPCGLVFAFSNYHLFFQHNPFANKWGHMSWGHATTPDLVHWKQRPVAIPDSADVAIFTGSSVVDDRNSSGLCPNGKGGCIVSVYTGYTPKGGSTPEKQTQNLAVSSDGVTWTKYAGNPVLDLGRSDSRDPKVFWHEPTKQWILVIVWADEKQIHIFGSPDLKHWKPLSEFGPQGSAGGQWECPDLYSLPVEGSSGQTKWVLKIGLNPGHPAGGSGEQYFIGNFDGTRFHNDAAADVERWVDFGRDSYCEFTFNHDEQSGQRHELGWMNNWQYAGDAPTSPWRGGMTIAKTLHLKREPDGPVDLLQQPVEQLKLLRAEHFQYRGDGASELNTKLSHWPQRSQSFEMEISADVKAGGRFEWALLKGAKDQTLVGYDAAAKQLYVDRTGCAEAQFSQKFPSRTVAPLSLAADEPLRLHVFVDRSSVELFAQDGRVVMTNLVFPKADSTGIAVQSSEGSASKMVVDIWRLNSIWK